MTQATTIFAPCWDDAITHLRHDLVMAQLITRYPDDWLFSRGDPFYTLARAIIGQQVSVQSADATWAKLEAQTDNAPITPTVILALSDEQLRACGFSRQKLRYIRLLATFFLDEQLHTGSWDAMSDEEVITHITQVTGIGQWTAHMFLMFCLLRPNILPLGDIGLQRAIYQEYGVAKAKPFPDHIARELSQTWHPYCSAATWFLWRAVDPEAVGY